MNQIAILVLSSALFAFFGASCSPAAAPPRTAVYFWKTVLNWQDDDDRRLAQADVSEIYVRLFDWDAVSNGRTQRLDRVGTLRVQSLPGSRYRLVPVVYVTLAALRAWAKDPGSAGAKANRLWENVQSVLASAGWPKIDELQIDADWSASTREAYFAVLEQLKTTLSERQAKLSATVRLHQFRDRTTQGIPPVDSAVLMVYGMQDPRQYDAPYNAVLDARLAKSYLVGQEAYPIELAYAWPTYAVARQFNAYRRFVALVPDFSEAELSASVFDRYDGGYLARSSTVVAGRPVMINDVLKFDRAEVRHVEETLRALGRDSKKPFAAAEKILFFDYDRNEWSSDEYQKIRALFRP